MFKSLGNFVFAMLLVFILWAIIDNKPATPSMLAAVIFGYVIGQAILAAVERWLEGRRLRPN